MRGTTQMDRELPVRLTDDEIVDRAQTMSAKIAHVGRLRKKRREDLRSINALIESEIDEVERIAATISTAEEMRKQGDLFVGDQVVTDAVTGATPEDATAVLSDVAAMVEPKYHRDGALCRKDPCKRRHLTLEQCQANEIVAEGQPLGDGVAPAPPESGEVEDELDATDERPKCAGCENILTATEMVKGLGICETCQTQPHEEVVVRTDGTMSGDTESQTGMQIVDESAIEDDPRPRCKTEACRAVLNADEVDAGFGLCSRCVDAATSNAEQPAAEAQA